MSGTTPPIVLTGATATGKTALSIAVAEALDAEIISMDSRQVYRGLDIGTAKPERHLRLRVPHHGLDIVDPSERYSAGRFAADTQAWIADIQQRGRLPLIVGGTGFFLKALTDPMFQEPELPERVRADLKSWLVEKSSDELQRWLQEIDPASAAALAQQGGRQRKARALEIALLTGQTIGWWHQQAPPAEPPMVLLVFLLELPREDIYRRINRRVIDMIDAGLVQEVSALMDRGFDQAAPGMNATGYSELIPYVRGQTELAAAVDAIQRATRRYARRQHTWFRHQLPAGTVPLDARLPVADLVRIITEMWRGSR